MDKCTVFAEAERKKLGICKEFVRATRVKLRHRVSLPLTGHYTDHMSKQVTATEAKATILRLLDDAAGGEEIEITKHGLPVARLVPASGARSLEGSFEGVAMTAVEEEQLFSTGEVWNAS